MSTLATETFPGAPGGSNIAIPQSEIDDSQAYIIQDAFVHLPTYTQMRGPVQKASGTPDIDNSPFGIVSVLDPQGNPHVAVVQGYDSGSTKFSVLNGALTSWSVQIGLSLAPSAFPPIIATSPAPGGIMIGWSGSYGVQSAVGKQGIIYWGGGDKADYTNAATTTTREQTAVTCSSGFSANVAPGMWVYSGTQLIGQVRSVNSDTSITLVSGATKSVAAGSVAFKSIRGPYEIPICMTGEMTTGSSSSTVNGGGTKFHKQIDNTHTWDFFRWWDFNYEGTTSSIQSDIQLTFTGNAQHNNIDEVFAAIDQSSGTAFSTTANTTYGWIPASYAGRQWYANLGNKRELTYRLWFSNAQNAEALDTTTDGDWIEVKSSEGDHKPIRGMAPTHNSLLIFKEDETFALYGSSPDSFTLQRVHDDGLWSPMTIQNYNEGVIWAGKRGVYFYDGSSVTNLTEDHMGVKFRQGLAGINPDSNPMYSMLANHHYFLHFTWASPVVLTRGATTTTPNVWCMALNLDSGALTFHTNLRFRGSTSLPVSLGLGDRAFYVVRTSATTVGKIGDTNDLFNGTGLDSVTCYQDTAGPQFYMESKKFDLSDPLRLKRIKQLTLHYRTTGGLLSIDTVLGLNSSGVTLTKKLGSSSGLWKASRLRFTKKSQYFCFRIYADSAVTAMNIGPYQLKYKLLRPGRV